jgi:hypothetical protein
MGSTLSSSPVPDPDPNPNMDARLQELRREIDALEKQSQAPLARIKELEKAIQLERAKRAALQEKMAKLAAVVVAEGTVLEEEILTDDPVQVQVQDQGQESRVRPFACPMCRKTFTAKSSVTRHLSLVHSS